MWRFLRASILSISLMVTGRAAALAAPAPEYSYTFEIAAVFDARLERRSAVIDPDVFVADSSAPAGVGPAGIAHADGYRPARPGVDPPGAPLFSAAGRFLALTLGMWTGASGQGTLTCHGGRAQVVNRFRGLIPGGLYQLERLQFTSRGVIRTPLGKPDGSDSTFLASDGETLVSRSLPFCPAPTEAIGVAYHSDAGSHGAVMGQLGVNLHEQLIARLDPHAPLPVTGGPSLPEMAILGGAIFALGLGARRIAGFGRLPPFYSDLVDR